MRTILRALVGLLAAGMVFAADWPEFLGPNRDATSPETGLLDLWPETGPPVVWRKRIGTGYSAPSVRGDRLVLHHRQDDEEVVECFNPEDGQRLWRRSYLSRFVDPYGYNNGPRATPLLPETKCYAFGAEGKLFCLDLTNGDAVWQRDTAKDWDVPEAFFGVGSSPVLFGDRLLVMVGGQPNAGMVALDARSGSTLWENVGEETWAGLPKLGWRGEPKVVWKEWAKQASYATPVIAAIDGRPTALCLMRQGLVSLDPNTGKVNFSRWFRARPEESVNAANPVVVKDRVFISAAYYGVGSVLLQVTGDGREFQEVWAGRALEIHWATPVYHDGHLYAFSGRNESDARFRCVEFDTGKIAWDRDESWRRRRAGQPEVYGRGSCILADGKLIVLGEGGLLGLFLPDPSKPVELARWQVPELHYPCWTGPVLAQGRLYLRSEEWLLCYDLTDR